MAVTKAVLFLAATLALSGCMVDMAQSTPGASTSASCAPTSSQLSTFQTVESAILANTARITGHPAEWGCAYCHGQTSANPGKSVFLILTPPGGTPDTTTSTANYCTMKLKSYSKLLHPSEASHSGGVYPAADIPTYYDLIAHDF